MSSSNPYYVHDDEEEEHAAPDSYVEPSDIIDLSEAFEQLQPSLPAAGQAREPSKSNSRNLFNEPIQFPDKIVRFARLYDGTTIKVGDNVELFNHREDNGHKLQSGDFLRVNTIIHDTETDEIRLRGLRLVRAKYYDPIFCYKFNELVLELNVFEQDDRSPFIQGQEEVLVTEVLRKREIVLSHRAYETKVEDRKIKNDTYHNQRYPQSFATLSKAEQEDEIFYGARLVARNAHILKHHENGKFYEGEVRLLFRSEGDFAIPRAASENAGGSSRKTSIMLDDDEENSGSTTRQPPVSRLPTKTPPLTFGDFFCCSGGATQGAKQAGLYPKFGADKDNEALQVFTMNHPSAHYFLMDAHDISLIGDETKEIMKVDVLHLSPPCRYWSPAKTSAGQDDQANYESLKTVGPILEKLTPRFFSMEQTFGLVRTKEFRRYFHLLLNDIYRAGYNCRYKVEDASKFQVPQPRMRLLIIGARHGLPIPAFPEPVCGPPGSGLKPFVYVKDALRLLERRRPHARYDRYDDIAKKKRTNGPTYDPATSFLKGCVTRGGGDNHHYTGVRKFTAREVLPLQTFPIDYQLEFSPTKAIGFAGDAFPPKFAESVLLRIAQTAEAFKHGLIDAEEDTTDLRGLVASKGVVFSRTPSTPNSLFNGMSTDSSISGPNSAYRYLPRLADNDPEPAFATPAAQGRSMLRKREREAGVQSTPQRSSRYGENVIRSHFSQNVRRQRVQQEMRYAEFEEAFIDLSSDD